MIHYDNEITRFIKTFSIEKSETNSIFKFVIGCQQFGRDNLHEHVFAFGNLDNKPLPSGLCKKAKDMSKPRGGTSLHPVEKNSLKSLNKKSLKLISTVCSSTSCRVLPTVGGSAQHLIVPPSTKPKRTLPPSTKTRQKYL